MNSKPAISVVIAAYNEEKFIEGFLKQFDAQTLPRDAFEIIVVDGGSDDRTREIAERYADRVAIQKGRGIAQARNQGVDEAMTDIIAITDVDCVVPPDWLENMLQDFGDPDVVAVCGPDGPREEDPKAHFVFWFVRNFIRAAAALGVYTTGGTNTGVRREAFLKIGGYRSLPHSEDVDLGLRLARTGKIVYDKRLYVKFSCRRMEKYGYLNVLLLWLRSDLRLLASGDLPPRDYARQRY